MCSLWRSYFGIICPEFFFSFYVLSFHFVYVFVRDNWQASLQKRTYLEGNDFRPAVQVSNEVDNDLSLYLTL